MPHPEGYLLRAVRHLPKKARSGIYAGKHVNVVNRVSTEYEVRSRKYVRPNVQKVHLYSQALGHKVQLRVTTAALRAIDTAGGLDRYLLKTPDSLLHSDVASDLKFKLSHIYRHKQHLQQQEQQQLSRQGLQHHKAVTHSQLAAVEAAQRQALAAGGSSIRGHKSWGHNKASSFLPPSAAAAAAAQSQHS